jgi:erythromycin esterase
MMRPPVVKLLIIFFLFCNCFIAQGSEKPDSLLLIRQLNSTAMPVSLDSAFEQFSFLNNSIKESRIVGLGEATHGSHEFQKGNTEIMKYLITHMNFKVIVFESAFGGTDLLNKYIRGEDVSLKQAVYNIGFFHLMNNDVLDFANWLRDYNTGKKEDEQIQVYGCDSQSGREVIEDLVKFLEDHQALTDELKTRLNDLKDKFPESPKKELNQTAKLLENSFKALDAGEEIKQRLQIVIQAVDIASASKIFSSPKRDKYMAQNCDWIFKANHQKKMVIYAHNRHIAKATDETMLKWMGQHIKNLYPEYFVIGTGFNQGTVGLKGTEYIPTTYKDAINGSYDFLFKQCKYPSFYLDLDLLNEPELKSFISTKNFSRDIGGREYPDIEANMKRNYRKHTLSKSYDALLFFKESTPKKIMTWDKWPGSRLYPQQL